MLRARAAALAGSPAAPVLAVTAGTALALVLGGCAGQLPAPTGERVVASVGSSVVTEEQVLDRLGVPENGSPVSVLGASENPWEQAVTAAVRDELLRLGAVEAQVARSGDERAVQIRAAIDHEVARTPGLRPEAVTEAEARTWFAEHSADFAEVESATVSWAHFADAAAAAATLAELADPAAQFQSVTTRRGALESGTAALDHQGGGADLSVARIAFAIKCDGRAGMVRDPDARTWWVAHVDTAQCRQPDWTAQRSQVVAAAVAWDRLQTALRDRAAQHQRTWPVRMADGWQVPASSVQAG